MGWERRKRGARYYTRTRREGGRIVREYVGAGPGAEAVALLDAIERAERRERAEAWRAERDRLEAADRAVTELCELTEVLASGMLLLAGYHRHDRGEWRKRREHPQSQG